MEPSELQQGEASASNAVVEDDMVDFRVLWKKNTYSITFPLDQRVSKLKEHIHTLTGIPPAMMKLMYKGLVKDDCTLREVKVTSGAKMMVVGSTIDDVITVQAPGLSSPKCGAPTHTSDSKDLLCELKEHKTIIDKGIPEDVPPGFKLRQDKLPQQPLSGMINKYGSKVRLHFRNDLDQLWISTKERTEKVPLTSIRNVISEPIKDHEEYHIMALQMGPTELSRYWLYWVPAQYTEAIKDAILGNWQYF